VALLIFAIENLQPMRVQFFGQSFAINLGWITLGATLLGALCSGLLLLLLAPGRVAADWRTRTLTREQWRKELDFLRRERATRATSEERTVLLAENQRLQAQRHELVSPNTD